RRRLTGTFFFASRRRHTRSKRESSDVCSSDLRIFAITIAIMFASSLIASVATNVYYHVHLKPINDQKVTHIIQNTVSIYEQSAHQDIDEYLSTLTDLGYQFYLVDQKGNERFFGNPFRIVNLDQTHIERV